MPSGTGLGRLLVPKMLQRMTWVVAAWLALGALSASAMGTPGERVRDASDEIIATLKDPLLNRDAKWARVSKLISKAFDFESMSRSVLGANWRRATPEERRDFVQFFTRYLEEVYRTKIESYTDQEVRIDRDQTEGDRSVVDTTIISGRTEIPVSYKMRLTDDDWLVYDVVIEGVSLVSNYRNTFTAIAQTGGMQGLLTDVRRRIARQRQKQAAEN